MSAAQQSGTPATQTTAPPSAPREPMTDEEVERVLSKMDMSSALEPRSMPEVKDWADIAAESKMYGVTSRADAFMRIMTGRELGLTAATSLRCLFVMDTKNGKRIGMDASIKHALCLRSPTCEYFYCESSDPTQATFVCKRVDHPEKRLQFTIADATTAGLLAKDGPWKTYPQRMCEARCKAALALLEFSDILAGIDDIEDLRAEIAAAEKASGRPAVRMPAAVVAPSSNLAAPPANQGKVPTDEQQRVQLYALRDELLPAKSSDEVNEIAGHYKGKFFGERKADASKIKAEAMARVEAAAKAASEAARADNAPTSKAAPSEAAA